MNETSSTIFAIVGSEIELEKSTFPEHLLVRLRKLLTLPNPAFIERTRHGRWTGNIPEELCLLEEEPEESNIRMPRGAIHILRKLLADEGYTLAFYDLRVSHRSQACQLKRELRDYQQAAIQELLWHTQGLAILPCGGGKSTIGMGAIAETGQPTLVLVHTRDLLDQWRSTIRELLGMEPGQIGFGRWDVRHVTVATVQTLATQSPHELELLGEEFGLLIVDEAHHIPASTFQTVVSRLPCFYRLGLTATPERADGLSPILNWTIGPPIYELAHQELVDAGHLVVPKVVFLETGVASDTVEHVKLVQELVDSDDRNALIVRLAQAAARERRAMLILSGRVEHCHALAETLSEAGIRAEALTSAVRAKARRAHLDAFRQGELDVICATSLADEGLDVTRLERLVIATPTRAEGRTIQRLGRLMRPHPGKATPVLYDLVDDNPIALSQCRARRRSYRKALGPEASITDCTERTLS